MVLAVVAVAQGHCDVEGKAKETWGVLGVGASAVELVELVRSWWMHRCLPLFHRFLYQNFARFLGVSLYDRQVAEVGLQDKQKMINSVHLLQELHSLHESGACKVCHGPLKSSNS